MASRIGSYGRTPIRLGGQRSECCRAHPQGDGPALAIDVNHGWVDLVQWRHIATELILSAFLHQANEAKIDHLLI